MKKVLFLIHDLGQGGAEKVLVNLVNNMDQTQFDITVMTLFDVGVNKQFLAPHIHYKTVFSRMIPGNSHLMKLLTPKLLHRLFIKENYDIEISYLEGPCARVISGCTDPNTKKVCWIHIEMHDMKRIAESFRSEREAISCYNRFDKIVCVSKTVRDCFAQTIKIDVPMEVLYNTNESEKIRVLAKEAVTECVLPDNEIKLIGVGKLLTSKGFDRIIRIQTRLLEDGYKVHLYILGTGPEEDALRKLVAENGMQNVVELLGYQTNPYKFVSKADLFVCASFAEGFSTAATEALLVGTPVCTVNVAGMKEMLGDNNEYGVVVENEENALYQAISYLITNKNQLDHYRSQAELRGRHFDTQSTVLAVANMISAL